MTLIVLNRPVASGPRLQRINMFPGRHLGEEAFDREQDNADARLAPLLRRARPGIVNGLEIHPAPDTAEDGFTVTPGLAVSADGEALGLHYPLRAVWSALIDAYLERSGGGDDASGVYYVTLCRAPRSIDSPVVDPCQRTEFDPTRDSRLVVVGSLALARLTIDAAAIDTWPRERIENHVAADHLDGDFMQTLGAAVPLALAAIRSEAGVHTVRWLSPEAGRYEAVRDSGYRVLLNQVSAAMRRVMQRAAVEVDDATPLPDFLDANLSLDFLPATGQLPLNWLANPASTSPNLLWLPAHLGVDMVPVPEEAVAELLQRHLGRRVIDLRDAAGDRMRLLLAVNEPDYRPDLLDIPPTDAVLENDIYRYFMRAWDTWLRWRQQFDVLYHLDEASALEPVNVRALGLPEPEAPPRLPSDVFTDVIAAADVDEETDGPLPHPYDRGVPHAPQNYRDWLVSDDAEPQPPPVPEPVQDGLVVRYAIGLRELEALENRIRATRARLEKTRDFMLLQRQQLDSQTVALAALAGGVAGDGSGLKVARWLPFARMDSELPSPPAADFVASPASAAPSTVAPVTRFATGSAAMMAMPVSAQPTSLSLSQPFAQPVLQSFSLPGAAAPKLTTATMMTNPVSRTAVTGTVGAKTANIGQSFNASLLSSALQTNMSASAMLASKPQTFSAFELGINTTRLDLLSRVAKETVSTPAFQAREHRFGVMEHIRPEINEYAKAFRGMQDLRNTLSDLFDVPDARRLRTELERAGALQGDGNVTLRPEQLASRLEDPAALERRITSDANSQMASDVTADRRRSWRDVIAVQYYYEALFKAGKILTQWIAIVEARYNSIERRLQGMLREQSNRIAEVRKLAALIRTAREELESLDRQRIEQLGDYGVAQRLLDEDWRQVHARNRERTRILTTGLRGLYYVRPRTAPVTEAPADPLALRAGRSGDVVPGCDWEEDVDLPPALHAFFDAVAEIPMSDWSALKPLVPRLPVEGLVYLDQLRKARFHHRALQPIAIANSETLQTRLSIVQQQNRVVLQHWATAALPTGPVLSGNRTRTDAARVLSLADLATQGSALLRRNAEQLRERLEQCQYCLLEKLQALPPSLRLQWAQLAEDDRLRVEDVAHWPGLDRAERAAFNTTRTAAELVAWWFRQLDADASADSRAAMRNMVRASLIHASLGDPGELVSGQVRVPPRFAGVGERLRVTLNRAPMPGTRLQLLDQQQRVVATLAVEDHDRDSTEVRIVDMLRRDVSINTRFSVIAAR